MPAFCCTLYTVSTVSYRIVLYRIVKAEVTNNKILHCTRGIVLLKLTTDRHKASRGLSATAELLVVYMPVSPWTYTRRISYFTGQNSNVVTWRRPRLDDVVFVQGADDDVADLLHVERRVVHTELRRHPADVHLTTASTTSVIDRSTFVVRNSTQLNSTSSWVELWRYKRAFKLPLQP